MWNRRDYAALATAAFGAFALTLTAFWAAPLQAGDAHPATQSIKTSTLTIDSCQITAAVAEDKQIEGAANNITYLREGAIPSVHLTLVNSSKDKPAAAPIRVQLLTASVRDRLSRVPMIRPPAFSQDYNLSLKPGETKTLDIPFDKILTTKGDVLTLVISKQPAPDQNTPAPADLGLVKDLTTAKNPPAKTDPKPNVTLVKIDPAKPGSQTFVINAQPAATPTASALNPPTNGNPVLTFIPMGPDAVQFLRMAVGPVPANTAAKTPTVKIDQLTAINNPTPK